MNRKRLVKLASAVPDSEVEAALKTYGGHWVLVGDTSDSQELVHIFDNEVFRKFEALSWMDDDEVWATAKARYLLSKDLPKFSTHAELQKYVVELTREKYGVSA